MSRSAKRPLVVVITGASAGVGRAAVREFARHGAWIGLVARSRDGLEGARREVEDLGGRALAIPTDVAFPDQVEAAAEAVEKQFGAIDVWVNNAMASILSPAMDITTDEFRRVTDVTYLGYVYGTMAALRRMRPRDRGVIVQVGSALAYRSIPLQSAYCGAKHAVQGFVDSLRCELIHDGQSRPCHDGSTARRQYAPVQLDQDHACRAIPSRCRRSISRRSLRGLSYWAAHHRRREVCVGWPTVKAIMGNKFIPGLLDHYLAWIGYGAQQTDQRIDQRRPNNLFTPLPGDYGAHGKFDEGAREESVQFWLNRHRAWIGAAAVGLAAYAAKRWMDGQAVQESNQETVALSSPRRRMKEGIYG